MKNHKLLFGAIACSVIAMTISSCGKSDKIERFPEGTSMIKMMDSDLGTLSFDNGNSISVKLPSEDIEVIFNNKTPLTCSTKGRTLTLTLSSAPMSYETGTWSLSIRNGRVYTEATVTIK